jgi:UDP-2,3-diacylglucosamine hydrolase
VFGHRHLPIDYRLTAESRYINLGDWVQYFTYAVFNEAGMQLKTCGGDENKIIRKA